VPSGFEAGLSKVTARIVGQILSRVRNDARTRALSESARPLMAPATADGLLGELSLAEATALSDYLESPDFEQVALQAFLFRAWASTRARTEHVSAVREQIRHGLRLAVGLPGERLWG
jgi:hypothetical protein